MTRAVDHDLAQAVGDRLHRTAPPNAWVHVSRAAGNAALGAVYQAASPLSAQRAPKLDPAKVVTAAQQARASADAAQALSTLRWLTGLPGPMGALVQLQLMAGVPVGVDSSGNPVQAHVFPGQITEVAMVVAGVHGSEQSGVEVAERLLKQLMATKPYFTVVIVPKLFPGNVDSRAAWEADLARKQSGIAVGKYQQLRDKAGDIGRSTSGQEDPNRQFPDLGKDLDLDRPVDAKGRLIEPSNLALLGLINAFKPSRLVSIHAVKNFTQAGIFADPHPSVRNSQLAQDSDALAITMAKEAAKRGVHVAGNKRGTAWSSLYPGQDPKKSAEQIKLENAKGRSLGQWGPSQGMTVITVEVGEQYRSDSAVNDPNRAAELEAEAGVIREIFLGPPQTTPTPTPAPTPAVPVQPMLVGAAAAAAGNLAATDLAQRFMCHRRGMDGGS